MRLECGIRQRSRGTATARQAYTAPTRGLPTWEDAVINQRLIKAAYRSAAERREVALAEIEVDVTPPAVVTRV